MASNSDSDPTFGYLHCLEDPVHGVTAGYLIVSRTGRPLEFHCTAPVKPSHAQRILFGATLRRHLLGECLGGALVSRAKLKPTVLAISDADLAPMDGDGDRWLVLLADSQQRAAGWHPLTGIGGDALAPDGQDDEAVAGCINRLAESIEPAEPFDRVAEAIREAQRLGGEGGDARAAA
ncbi:MAG: hypothetical protein AAGJ46_20810 [Planctomycetota bacterium]